MRNDKHKKSLDQRLADILSEFVDRLNEGNAPPIEEFLGQYESPISDLKPMLEGVVFVKEKTRSSTLPAARKAEAFESIRARLLAQEEKGQIRAGIKRGAVALPLDRRPDFLLLLLYSMKKILGITRLTKLLFLMGKEAMLDQYVPDYYGHYAYDYGPFDKIVYNDIEALKQQGLIEERKLGRRKLDPDEDVDEGLYPEKIDAIYKLTPRGIEVAQAIAKSADSRDITIRGRIEEIKRKYGHLPLKRGLLKHVYTMYPDYAKNSKILNEILEDDA